MLASITDEDLKRLAGAAFDALGRGNLPGGLCGLFTLRVALDLLYSRVWDRQFAVVHQGLLW